MSPKGGGGIWCGYFVAGVASCITQAIQDQDAQDPEDGTRRARVARGGSYVTSIVARRPVFRGEFEAADPVNLLVKATVGQVG